MMMFRWSILLLVAGAACQPLTEPDPDSSDREPTPARSGPERSSANAGPARNGAAEQGAAPQRRIADELYAGMQALRRDYLLTPPEESAYRHFRRALAMDPGNEVALRGMQDIVERYLELVREAGRKGRFDAAETYLRRAAQVDDEHPGLAEAREMLERERERTHSVHRLSRDALASRSDSLVGRLHETARKARARDLFILITVPRDRMGRWIYGTMQEGIDGGRLRANIEIGDPPSLRLVRTGSRSRQSDG